MFELCKAGERTYYIDCPAKIGIFKADDTNVYLIDSGSDKDAGRRVKKILDEQGWTVRGIINNSDYICKNDYLQQQFGCKVFVSCPSLLAVESNAVGFSDADFPKELEEILLPGSFFHVAGFRTPDDVVFLDNCLSGVKNRIKFTYDISLYLNELNNFKNMKAALFVPSHEAVCENISKLVDCNITKVNENVKKVFDFCGEPRCFEGILKLLFPGCGLKMNFKQYIPVEVTVNSYIGRLMELEWLTFSRKNKKELWRRA